MWEIEKIFNFRDNKNFGFHDYFGHRYVLDFDNSWIGKEKENTFEWTAGHRPDIESCHVNAEIEEPTYLTGLPNGSLLVVSSGNKKIYKILLEENKIKEIDVFIDCAKIGLKDVGNCEWDLEGNFWVNEITGCKIWNFDKDGKPLKTLGNGKPGFQKKIVSFDEVCFNWIYDLRRGPDGNIYVLDSKNYAVRKIVVNNKTVELVAGTGEPGYSGDGEDALIARFGSNNNMKFDGPWSLALDEEGNIFIGDTQNHVVRMINKSNNKIDTIAGSHNAKVGVRNSQDETDLFKLNLPLICGLDYCNGRLFIPEWDGDLIILKKIDSNGV